MQAILTNVMASVLFVHAALGCCWHCASCCTGCENSVSAASGSTCCGHHQQTPKQPQTPCKCPLECHRVCIYVPTHRAPVEGPQLTASFDIVVNTCTLWRSQLAVSPSWERTREPLAAEPPVRLHLLHQLLLI